MSDIVIIGGGIAGVTAALQCAQRKRQVQLVEEGEIGGVCLNRGCIPTKTMLHYLNLARKARRAGEEGIFEGMGKAGAQVSLKGLQDYTVERIAQLRYGMRFRLKKAGAALIVARAKEEQDGSVSLFFPDGARESLGIPNVLIQARGADWRPPEAVCGRKAEELLLPESLLTMEEAPKETAVIGAGVTGVECAVILAGLGSRVSLYEKEDRILPGFDEDAAGFVKMQLEEAGVRLFSNRAPEELPQDKVMWCGGSRKRDVEEDASKSRPGTFYIGDIREDCSLASQASRQAIDTVYEIFGEPAEKAAAVPSLVYVPFPVAQITSTDAELSKERLVTAQAGYYTNGMAVSMDETQGFVKIAADRLTGELKSIVIAGEGADLMMGEASVLIGNHMTMEQLKRAVHPHPSLCELLAECVAQL